MTTARSDTSFSSEKYDLLIDGESVSSTADEYFPVLEPATEEVLCEVAAGGAADIDYAVDAARNASEQWQSVPPRERGQVLREIARQIRTETERLATIHQHENGKPISQARDEVETCAEYFEYYAGMTDKLHGDSIPLTEEYVDYTVQEPLGVTGHIIPWNFPVGILGRSIAPALAAGNTVVVKPAEQTPIATLEIAALVAETQLPDGAVNVVPGFGDDAGAALSTHRDIDGLAFTGSVETGQKVAAAAGQNLIPIHVEAGGKNPNVVFPDADLDAAVESTVTSIFGLNAGQVCSAGDRLLVHTDIEQEFLDRLIEVVEDLSVDDGGKDPDVGPVVSQEQYEKILDYVTIGREEVGDPIVGGNAIDRAGYFIEPTIFTNVSYETRLAQDEIFGPVLAVSTFESEQEAIELANATEFGLVAGIFTKDVGRAHRFAREVDAGQIFINEWFAGGIESPFGGYKLSGFGREKGLEALENYLQTKNVCARIE